MYKTKLKMERIYRDGLDPYKHPTLDRMRELIPRYFKYLTFYLLFLLLILKTICMLIRHVLFPILSLDSSRFAITMLSTFSEFIVLLCLTILYRPQIESNIYLSGTADDSDYVVIVSVILTKHL